MGAHSDDEDYLEVDDIDERAASLNGDDSSEDDSDSDEEAGPYETQSKRTVKELLEITLHDIQHGKLDLTNQSQLHSFQTGDGIELTRQTGDSGYPTALHIIANKDKKDLPKFDSKMEPLIKHLAAHNGTMKAKDQMGQTSLYRAIEAKKEKMVQWMCDAHFNVNAILAISGSEKNWNCIHVGIEKKVKFLDLLIEKADGATLAAKDRNGNTPLHLAVEYKKCRKEQLDIIARIVEKSDGAVQAGSGDLNVAGRSPYLHHKEDVRRAKAREAEKEAKKHLKEDKVTDRQTPGHGRPDAGGTNPAARETLDPASRTVRVPASPMVSAINPMSAVEAMRPDKGRTSQVESRTKYGGRVQGAQPSVTLAVPTLELSQPGETADEVKKSSRQQDSSKSRDAKASSTEAHKSKVDETTVKDIERFLKMHYLRCRSYNAALEILYGRNVTPDVELFFDLCGHVKIKQSRLVNLMSKLKFEDILQYIEIPKLNITPETNVITANSKKSRAGPRAKQPDGQGRRDLCDIFERLRKKGVKTILKVIVDDMESPAHSDDAIEEALKSFDVEIWNWKRVDLCSEVIHRVAPTVREVHLYWSGNNAVLRGWSEAGGLKKLENLREVHLHAQQGLETSVRTKQNVEEFCKQMKEHCPDVQIFKEYPAPHKDNAELAALRAEEMAEHATKHEWISCMREFRKFLFDAEAYHRISNVSESIEEPIKVALIDDGVDIKDFDFNLIGGRTFCPRDEVHNLNAPYYVSSMGHGTTMAKQIQLLCPRAQFYVLRLEDCGGEEGGRQITARSAADAILAAVRKKVHIISMSWTIDPPEDEAERTYLDKAIAKAANADILMFCSASDKGAKTGLTYPAKATTKIFTIGGATAAGAADAWVGDLRLISFLLPGVKVELDGAGNDETLKDATGSSVATALAAGLAALILYCAQVRILLAGSEAEKGKARRHFHNLKTHDQMRQAIKDIGTTEDSHHKFIEVWSLFGKKIEDKDQIDQEKWLDVLADIGATLCRKMV